MVGDRKKWSWEGRLEGGVLVRGCCGLVGDLGFVILEDVVGVLF